MDIKILSIKEIADIRGGSCDPVCGNVSCYGFCVLCWDDWCNYTKLYYDKICVMYCQGLSSRAICRVEYGCWHYGDCEGDHCECPYWYLDMGYYPCP